MTARRVIIDTDPGLDDAVAILLAFASPELEVLGLRRSSVALLSHADGESPALR